LAKLSTGGELPIQLNWQRTHKWDAEHGNGNEIKERDPNRTLLEAAIEQQYEGTQDMFPIWKNLADNGSVYAMNKVAWCYWTGTDVDKNVGEAESWYSAAMAGGSQWASLRLAELLAENGDLEGVKDVLGKPAASGWAPAMFWLAWHRLRSSQTASAYSDARLLLEGALEAGHPGAKWYLGRLMAQGKYGSKDRKRGRKLLMEMASELRVELEHDITLN
jgi:TPR repeat protein